MALALALALAVAPALALALALAVAPALALEYLLTQHFGWWIPKYNALCGKHYKCHCS